MDKTKHSVWGALICSGLIMFPNLVLAGLLGGGGFLPPRSWIGRPIVTGPVVENTVDVSSNREVIFRTFYDRSNQTGDIVAEPVKLNSTGSPNTSRLNRWLSPAGRMFLKDWRDRRIFTNSGSGGVPFDWDQMPSAQRNAVGSKNMVNYIRGDRGNERPMGERYRRRTGLLGEIVHSNLYYWVHNAYGADPLYASSGPPERLYVGANDGMLHVFDAKTGEEMYAYVPSQILGDLHYFARDRLVELADELLPTRALLDGQITISRAKVPPSHRDVTGYRTVLVGSLGAGGKGLYALDVSDPFANGDQKKVAREKVMWEIGGGGDFENMGHVYGAARIATLKDGRKVVITGNGYYSKVGRAALFVIDMLTGKLIKEIRLPGGSLLRPVGLSTPTVVDTDIDGRVNVAYAGDTKGRLWRFDLDNLNAEPVMMFEAEILATRIVDGIRNQPITTPPVVQRLEDGNYMVLFGTGMLLTPQDRLRLFMNDMYGILDDGKPTDDNELAVRHHSDGRIPFQIFKNYRTIKDPLIFRWRVKGKGWRLDLPFGERVIGFLPSGSRGHVHLVTNRWMGDNWMYVLDAKDGGPPKCPVFDIDRDGRLCPGGKPDDGDMFLWDLIETIWEDIPILKALDFRDRIPVAAKIDDGVVSQPILLSNGKESTITPIFNWNRGRSAFSLQDPDGWQLFDGIQNLRTRAVRYKTEVLGNGDIVVKREIDVRGLFGRTRTKEVERIYFAKDGSVSVQNKRKILNRWTSKQCFSNCGEAGLIGNESNSRWKQADVKLFSSQVQRESWRVLSE